MNQFGKFQRISSSFDPENPLMDVGNDSGILTHLSLQVYAYDANVVSIVCWAAIMCLYVLLSPVMARVARQRLVVLTNFSISPAPC